MLMYLKNNNNVQVEDFIAVTKNDEFVGYMTIQEKMDELMLVDADKAIVQMMNELQGEDIPYTLDIQY